MFNSFNNQANLNIYRIQGGISHRIILPENCNPIVYIDFQGGGTGFLYLPHIWRKDTSLKIIVKNWSMTSGTSSSSNLNIYCGNGPATNQPIAVASLNQCVELTYIGDCKSTNINNSSQAHALWELVNVGLISSYTSTGGAQSQQGNTSIGMSAYCSDNGRYQIAIGYGPYAQSDYTIAIGSSANASGYQSIAIGTSAGSGGNYSIAMGATSAGSASSTASGAGSNAIGGAYASGADSLALALATNSSSYGARGGNSVAIGRIASVSSTGGIAISGGSFGATVSGNNSISIGNGAQTASTDSICIGGGNIQQAWSVGFSGAYNQVACKYSFGGGRGFSTSSNSYDSNYGLTRYYASSSSATPVTLTTNGSAASTNNILILDSYFKVAFDGLVVASQDSTSGTKGAAWQVSGFIRRDSTAASTTLVASTVTAISNVPGWTLALSADTTNGGLSITFTGEASVNVRVQAHIRSTELSYQ